MSVIIFSRNSKTVHTYYTESALFARLQVGARLLSGRVLNLGSKGYMFKTHLWQCIVYLSKTLYPLLSTGSTQDSRKSSQATQKLLTGM